MVAVVDGQGVRLYSQPLSLPVWFERLKRLSVATRIRLDGIDDRRALSSPARMGDARGDHEVRPLARVGHRRPLDLDVEPCAWDVGRALRVTSTQETSSSSPAASSRRSLADIAIAAGLVRTPSRRRIICTRRRVRGRIRASVTRNGSGSRRLANSTPSDSVVEGSQAVI